MVANYGTVQKKVKMSMRLLLILDGQKVRTVKNVQSFMKNVD